MYRRARFAVTAEDGRRVCAQVYVQHDRPLGPPSPAYARVIRRAYKRLGFDARRLAVATAIGEVTA